MTRFKSPGVLFLIMLLIMAFVFVSPKALAGEGCLRDSFIIENPDFQISPHTGMTREHWKSAAKYLLEGAFTYVTHLDDPMKFPKQSGKSYPLDEKMVPIEKLEGLSRTLFLAAPLLREDSSLVINGIKVADYYRHQILALVDPQSPSYIAPRPHNGGPSQILVEFGALAISMSIAPEVIWAPLSSQEKIALAKVMLSYGDGPTINSNWKFFNIFILSFFKDQGYEINEALLKEYLEKSLGHYKGEGWYNDNPAYDYYSIWGFQLYGIIWSELYGKKYYTEFADRFIRNFDELTDNYPLLFSRDGKMVMWGRSISYRFASASVFPFTGLYNNRKVDLGWMRRIASGTLLQFLQHPAFLDNHVPTLGFYGAFEPAVQIYSCRGSVYWMGKFFLGLLLPESNPFWTSKENSGVWETFSNDRVYNTFSAGTNILISDYPEIGASEIRAWCHERVKDDWQKFRSTENYNRLAYNSAFPWQADGDNGEVAMNYLMKNSTNAWEAFRLYRFKQYSDGVYYRDAVLETDEAVQMNLVDIPLPNGILRVDRNTSQRPVEMRLGHYALPQVKGVIKAKTMKAGNYVATIIDNGVYQLAMIPVMGWEGAEVLNTYGLHPESPKSSIINLKGKYEPDKGGQAPFISLMLWKPHGVKWTASELMPIKAVLLSPGNGQVLIKLKNGMTKRVLY